MKKLMSIVALFALAFSIVGLGIGAAGLSASAAVVDSVAGPGDVANVVATPLNGGVKLTWDAATSGDNELAGYHVYYGTTPATQPGHVFDSNVDVGNVVEYMVNDLANGTEYFFAVIAYDNDDPRNESAKWSNQPSATPSEEAGEPDDQEAPQVASAEAVNMEKVKVVFSEKVVLPENDPGAAFTLENDDTLELLPVTDAMIDEGDETGKTVLLMTAEQTADAPYRLTVGVDIKDISGNPMISGTSDTAAFDGSGAAPEPEDNEPPQVTEVEVLNSTTVIVHFNEGIVLAIDPSTNFRVNVSGDKGAQLDILGVRLEANRDGVEDASAILTTSAQTGDVDYAVQVLDVSDNAGNMIGQENSGGSFVGIAPPEGGEENGGENGGEESGGENNGGENGGEENGAGGEEPDTDAPEDVLDFIAKKTGEAGKYVVELSWKAPLAKDWDSMKQLLSLSDDRGNTYMDEAELGTEERAYQFDDLEPGEYWFKLAQEDEAGNESEGVIAKVMLSETGPGMIGLVALSLYGGRRFGRRRK